ncbi:MAG: hypothetical protein IJA35_06720 [Clostridia bacterium]|nr:hypothetical protein [Clostridia bacterium]
MKYDMEHIFIESLKKGTYPHAFLISCADILRAEELAFKAALCICRKNSREELLNYPNFMLIEPFQLVKREDRIDFKREILIPPDNGRDRVILFKNAHQIPENVQNAILKTLEEPPDATVLLLSGIETGLLPTVRSRCTKLRLAPLDDEAMRKELSLQGIDEVTDDLLSISQGALFRAVALCGESSSRGLYDKAVELVLLAKSMQGGWNIPDKWLKDRDMVCDILEYMLSFIREMMFWHDGLENISSNAQKNAPKFTLKQLYGFKQAIIAVLKRLKSLNVRTEEAMDYLMARFMEIAS